MTEVVIKKIRQCGQLVIIDGCDGTGKTTLVDKMMERLDGSIYVHHGAYKHVTDGFPRLCFESMLPALVGGVPLVMDRCWLDEPIYGAAYRNGKNRLGRIYERMLHRAALRAGVGLIICDPGWDRVVESFRARQAEEYLDNEQQLRAVYDGFQSFQATGLMRDWYDHGCVYDYRSDTFAPACVDQNPANIPIPHALQYQSAGNRQAPVVIVGEDFGEHKNQDSFFQLPFISFSQSGCSYWITEQLELGGILERQLMWVNADQLEDVGDAVVLGLMDRNRLIVALGQEAGKKLKQLGVNHTQIGHPQHHKRFHFDQEYDLVPVIKNYLQSRGPTHDTTKH